MTANHNNFDSTESEAHPVETTEETIMLDENVSILSASEGDSSIVADLEMHEDVKQPEEVVEIVDVGLNQVGVPVTFEKQHVFKGIEFSVGGVVVRARCHPPVVND